MHWGCRCHQGCDDKCAGIVAAPKVLEVEMEGFGNISATPSPTRNSWLGGRLWCCKWLVRCKAQAGRSTWISQNHRHICHIGLHQSNGQHIVETNGPEPLHMPMYTSSSTRAQRVGRSTISKNGQCNLICVASEMRVGQFTAYQVGCICSAPGKPNPQHGQDINA